MNSRLARLLGALLAITLIAAACGGDDDDITTAAGQPGEDGQAEPASEEEVDPDAADCAADGADCGQMVDGDMDAAMDGMDMEDGHDHEHSHGDVIDVPDGMAVPQIEISVTPDPKAGQNLQVTLTDFAISPESASTDAVDGEGHLHLYINGERKARFYNEWMHLSLPAGEHVVEVEISANNHSAYAVDGEPIRAMAMVTVPESEGGHSHGDDDVVDVADGDTVPSVELAVFEDPKSGWNLQVSVENFTITPENASTEHVDGEGHMHIYVDGEKLTRLYGEWWHLNGLTEGDHEVMVELSANDHRPYAVGGEPIVATATISVSADQASDDEHAHDEDHGDDEHAHDEDHGDDEHSHDEDHGDDEHSHDHDHDDMEMGETMDMDAAEADTVVEIGFVAGEVTVEDDRIAVERDSTVALVITSDVAEHVHVHGFDLFADVGPGETATLVFQADVPGVFEIEFEDSFTFITELEVR